MIAKSFARIHWQSLANFGILPLTFVDKNDWGRIERDDVLAFEHLRDAVRRDEPFEVHNRTKNQRYTVQHALSDRQIQTVLDGSLITIMRERVGHA